MSSPTIALQRPSWKDEYLELLCGISNAGGGTLTVATTGKASGSDFKKMQRVLDSIPSLTQNSLGITCTTEPVIIGGELCLEISAPPSTNNPINYQGKYYLYKDDTNQVVSKSELEKRLDALGDMPWELRVQPMARLNDVEPYMLDWLVRGLSQKSGLHERLSEEDIERLLIEANLKDSRSNALTNAGVLLLHKTPDRFIPGAMIRIGLFDTNKFGVMMQSEITGPVNDQLEGAVNAIFESYLPELPEKEAVPIPAITEAIRNALVHKDYEKATPINISVFPDKMIISNIGHPPATWGVNEFVGRHTSRPTNPVLASVLQKVGAFDGWGNGISTLVQAWKQAGLPEPIFELRPDETIIDFPLVSASSSESEKSRANSDEKSREVSAKSADEAPTRATEEQGVSGNNGETKYLRPSGTNQNASFMEKSIAAVNDLDLTSTDEFTIKVLTTNGRATANDIASFLNVSESTVRRSFRKLKELGMISRVGSAKAGYWKVMF